MNYGMEDESPKAETAAPEQETEESKEPVSVFLKKEAVGRDVKEGDVLTMTVKSIDPETGEVEGVFSAGESEPEKKPMWEERMNAMGMED